MISKVGDTYIPINSHITILLRVNFMTPSNSLVVSNIKFSFQFNQTKIVNGLK